jgi:hypothetical protein
MISIRISSSGSTDGRPVVAVERRQACPNSPNVDEAVDRSQHMVKRHMLLNRELVKEGPLLDMPLTHHLLHSSFDNWSESAKQHHRNLRVFQQNLAFSRRNSR